MTSSEAALSEFRRQKDAYFASGRGPLRGEALGQFTGLSYYPPNAALVFQLPLERGAGEQVTFHTSTGQTSTGELRQMQLFGTVLVPFPEGEATLTLYAQPGEDAPGSLFFPFRDLGSGSESYGAGRYLDAPTFQQGGAVWVSLDFNLAYYPYCAYGEGWTCPLPPAHNWLKVAVRAGEKLA